MTGRLVDGAAWSSALGEEVRYRAWVPAVRDGERCATAYLLHGRGDDLEGWSRVVPRLEELVDRGLVPPLVAVVPDAPWSGRGSWYVDSRFTGAPAGRPVETALVRDLVSHVDATYPTAADRSHRLVGGCSMGGAGALSLLLRHPGVFAGGLVLSPAVYDPLPPAHSSARTSGAFGRGDDRFVEEVYAAHTVEGLLAGYARAGDLPVRLFLAVGEDEWRNPLPQDARHDLDRVAAAVHDRVRRADGVSSRLVVLPGGHGWDVWEPAFAAGLPHLLAALAPGCAGAEPHQ